MKKSVILTIGVIYIVAICVVGFIGIKLSIDNPTIYVDEIVCESENFTTKTLTEDDKAKGYIGVISATYQEGIKIPVKCKVLPENATYPKLNYEIGNKQICNLTVQDGVAMLEFTSEGSCSLIVSTTDGHNTSVKIKIIVTDVSGIL